MCHRAFPGRTNILGITPECARLIIMLARPPIQLARCKDVRRHVEVDRACHGIDADFIAILDQGNRAAIGGFRTDMANATFSPMPSP